MRRFLLRLEVLVVLVVAACLVALSASSGAPERPELQLTSGPGDTLTLSNSKEGSAILSLGGMRPGDSVTDTVTIGNTGTIPGDLTLSTSNLVDTPGAGGGVLSGELDLRVRDITNAGSPVTVYDGKIGAVGPVALGALAAGASRVYEFRVSFPDAGPGVENAYQGSAMSIQFDWTAFNPDSGDTDPPETTITSAPPSLSSSPDATFAFSADEPGSTFECALDGGAYVSCSTPVTYNGLVDGSHSFAVRATDAATNVDPTPASHAWTIDTTAPNVSLADPGAYLRGTVALNASADDGSGSGVASLVIHRSPAGAGTWTNTGASWNTTNVPDGSYDLRARATDNAGNAANSAVRTVTVDNARPVLASSAPADGTVLTSAASLAVTANETLANLEGTIDGAPATPAVSGDTATFAGPFADGPHTLAGELVDLAGNRKRILVHFTIWNQTAADFPWVEKNCYSGSPMTLRAADDNAQISVPAGAWSGAPAGDWLVVRIDPRPADPASGGFQSAGDVYRVTAYWGFDGADVHEFDKALDLLIEGGGTAIVPATLANGEWRAIPPVPSGQTLPSGWQDGYYLDGTDVHVLTRHLSSFTLLEDVQAPSKPKKLSGANKKGRLVLKWKAASDNGAVGAYLVYANGNLLRTLGASARKVDLGKFKTSDKRSFQVAARDTAGNLGAKTARLVVIPRLRNLTVADATARLTARGLKAGKLTYRYSSEIAAGRVIRARRSGLVTKGASIGLRVSRGAMPRSPSSTPPPPPPPPSSGTPPPFPSFAPTTPPGTDGSATTPPPLSAPTDPASETGDPSHDPEVVVPESFSPADEESSPLRRLLGLTLLGGAFLAAGGVAWKARRAHVRPRPAESALVEPLVFWDQRLLQSVSSTIRRFTGR
jgi:Bacterial Ig-like domain (group 3)